MLLIIQNMLLLYETKVRRLRDGAFLTPGILDLLQHVIVRLSLWLFFVVSHSKIKMKGISDFTFPSVSMDTGL